MASSTNNEIPSAIASNDSPPPSQQNAPAASQSRHQSTTSSAMHANISRPAMAPAQPQPMLYNAPNTRASRELRLMIGLRHQRVHVLDSNPFVDHIIGELQDAFEAQCMIGTTGAAITDEGELLRRKIECLKAGLYALRSIHTAWLKFPAVGGRLEGAPIGVVDFRFTAMSAPAEKPEGQLAAHFARIMADTVDPPQDDIESAPHAQLRVNNCFLAIKKQFVTLYDSLGAEQMNTYLFEDDTLSEDEAAPKTYFLSTTAALHPPSTASQLMSARGLMDAAEFEDDDNQHIVVTGGVLRSKAEKRADLAIQVAKAKKAESDQAARERTQKSAGKTAAAAKKSDTPPVESEEDEEGDEEVESPESPLKEATAKKAAASKIKGGNKAAQSAADEQGNGHDAITTEQPVKKTAANSRKRSAPVASLDDGDADVDDDTTTKPAPKKRAKSTPATKKTTSDKSSETSPTSGTSGESGSVAPNIVKRGGAAPKWLKDEDDFVKQTIVDHPDWPMPTVYKHYSAHVANTPYQREGQAVVEYRADFVEFPKDIIVGDKERRKYDIAFRTYESVRQHTEKFKANVSNANTFPPYTWTPAQANLVAGQPKSALPPRPAFFNNAARTPVPQVDPLAPLSSVSLAALPAPSAAPAASTGTRRSSGWNAVNVPAPVVRHASEEAVEEAASPGPQSAEGDAQVSTLEEFVDQQSAPPSSAGEEQNGDEDEDLFE